VHVEFVHIGQSSYLIVSGSRKQANSNSRTFIFVWSNRRQKFLLYQYLSTRDVVSVDAVLVQNFVYLAIHEESGKTLTTRLFFWNGTYFDEFMSFSGAGLVFSMGSKIFKIVDSIIYRLNLDSKEFTFHSTLPGPENSTITASSSFAVSNEYFIAGSLREANEKQSLFIYRMTGFDFDPYQNLPMTGEPFVMKILWQHSSEAVVAVMKDNVIKLLQWSHM